MTEVATHIARALDLEVLLEALARKLTLEVDGARQAGEKLVEVPRSPKEGEE